MLGLGSCDVEALVLVELMYELLGRADVALWLMAEGKLVTEPDVTCARCRVNNENIEPRKRLVKSHRKYTNYCANTIVLTFKITIISTKMLLDEDPATVSSKISHQRLHSIAYNFQLIHHTVGNFNIQPDKLAVSRINESLSTLQQARDLRVREAESALKSKSVAHVGILQATNSK